jgi:cell division control protein 7
VCSHDSGQANVSRIVEGLRHKDQVTIVLEYIEIVSFQDALRVMGVSSVRDYMKSLFLALEYVHSFGVIHRDIKPGNFLVNPVERKYLLIDFGLAEYQSSYDDKHEPSRAGTRGFRAPEVLVRHGLQTTAVDIWSAGIILLSLLTRRYPFLQSFDDLYSLTEIMCFIPYPEMKEKLKRSYNKTLEVSDDIAERNTFTKDLKSFCKKSNIGVDNNYPDSVYDLLEKCLDIDHKSRLSAKEALKHDFFKE